MNSVERFGRLRSLSTTLRANKWKKNIIPSRQIETKTEVAEIQFFCVVPVQNFVPCVRLATDPTAMR